MKVLFAVSNENISTQIVKRYQKEYKEIISYKNMYYFNAIVKELQRDKSYDRIIISEDLEPFVNNNSDSTEKFIFEKLDNISDEATGLNGKDIPIILLATDKRVKSEPILVKLFGIGIYNVLLGQDRTTANVCNLLNKPRNKKEAKLYYKIEAEEVNYKSESEDNVSETEIKNILNHYRRLGKDEDRYVESFNNIAAQYNDAQLRIITKFLPLNVKAVLEEQSPKYQSVMTFLDATPTKDLMQKKTEEEGLKVGFLNYTNSNKPSRPVIVPTAVKKVAMKKSKNSTELIESEFEEIKGDISDETPLNLENIEEQKDENILPGFDDVQEISDVIIEQEAEVTIKRGRGRPKKVIAEFEVNKVNVIKRGRGRPKKISQEEITKNENVLSDFEEIEDSESTILPEFDEIEGVLPEFNEVEETLPGFDEVEEEILPGFDEVEEETLLGFDEVESKNNFEEESELTDYENNSLPDIEESNDTKNIYSSNTDMSTLLSKDKKVVSFVGTTKSGTSFLVNNLGKCLSSMGIKTAILDLTLNKNSYYIYTKNEETLRNTAYESIKKLKDGVVEGILVDKNLDVYTALPGDKDPVEDVDGLIATLLNNYSIILIDCDFSTPSEYFRIAQEIYIVQTMDILTIQPVTAFLRDLKAKEILDSEKIRVIINKQINVSGLTPKVIIGGLAFYNDPSMSFMTELFDRNTVKYFTVPYDMEVCSKYLEGVMNCEISIKVYSKRFNAKLKELANMVYPLLGKKSKNIGEYSSGNNFSDDMNNTLERMKNKY